jgi:hypothetical protein
VLIRGKVDHKDKDKTVVIAEQVERFDPSPAEVQQAREAAAKPAPAPTPLRLCVDATALRASALTELKDLLAGSPGEADVVIELATSSGRRRLRLGPGYRVSRTAGLYASLDSLLGSALVSDSPTVAGQLGQPRTAAVG